MIRLSLAFFGLVTSFRLVQSLSPAYMDCQLQKRPEESALIGCPEGTLYVSPTDPRADFSSVQGAIDFLPQTGSATILIGEGQYFEMVNVTRSAPLTLLGQLDSSCSFGNTCQHNIVQIWNNLYAGDLTDEETATLTVARPHGQSLGNVDFRAYNIDFENRAANYAIAQALVTSVVHANASFYGCTFASWQDTWYTGHGANTYAVNSTIFGQTDYLFGSGKAWFQSVTLANRACGGGITAWQGALGTRNGVYIADSQIIRSPDANATTVTAGHCYLGRPWNVYAVAVFLRNYMDDSIQPEGFTPWQSGPGATVPDTTFYAEFDSYGPGGDLSARITQDHILDFTQAQGFTLEEVFDGTPSWIDFEYQY